MAIHFILIQNRQGKTRLAKWYNPYNDDEKIKLKGEVHRLVAPRDQKHQSNFVEFRGSAKLIYRRYAGLFFCFCVDANDNELAYLEAIHFFVEVLDEFFGSVCELDLVFNFWKVYAILDEILLAGEIQETSKQVVLTRLEHLHKLDNTWKHRIEPDLRSSSTAWIRYLPADQIEKLFGSLIDALHKSSAETYAIARFCKRASQFPGRQGQIGCDTVLDAPESVQINGGVASKSDSVMDVDLTEDKQEHPTRERQKLSIDDDQKHTNRYHEWPLDMTPVDDGQGHAVHDPQSSGISAKLELPTTSHDRRTHMQHLDDSQSHPVPDRQILRIDSELEHPKTCHEWRTDAYPVDENYGYLFYWTDVTKRRSSEPVPAHALDLHIPYNCMNEFVPWKDHHRTLWDLASYSTDPEELLSGLVLLRSLTKEDTDGELVALKKLWNDWDGRPDTEAVKILA